MENVLTEIAASEQNLYFQKMLSSFSEDKQLYDQISDIMKSPYSKSRLKDSTLMQVLRLVSEDGHDIPNAMPEDSEEVSEVRANVIKKVLKKFSLEGEPKLKEVIAEARRMASNYAGTSFVLISPIKRETKNKKKAYGIKFKVYSPVQVYCDPKATNVQNAEWVALKEDYSETEGKSVAKSVYGFGGKIDKGSPIREQTQETTEKSIRNQDEGISFVVYINRVKKQYIVFAGGNKRVVQKLEGKDFPFINGDNEGFIPVYGYDATSYRYGIYAMSYTGVSKDLSREIVSQYVGISPQIARTINPIFAVYGEFGTGKFKENLAEALEMQEVGAMGLIPISNPNSKMDKLFPPDNSEAFLRITTVFENTLAKRLGLNLSIQEKSVGGEVPTATQVIEQKAQHSKAISNQNKINADMFYARLYNGIIFLAEKLLDGDKNEYDIYAGEGKYKLTGTEISKILKGWSGWWTIDPSVNVKLTKQEWVAILDSEFKNILGLTTLNGLTKEFAKVVGDILWAKYTAVGIDKIIQRQEFDGMMNSFTEREVKQDAYGQAQKLMATNTKETPEIQRQAARMGGNAIQSL